MLTLAGCALPDGGADDPEMSSVEMGLDTVPPGVLCIKVVVTIGSQTVTPPLMTVASGASTANLSLGLLPAGAATFNGSAYNAACSSVTASTVPNWVSDPATATLAPGGVTNVAMTFHDNNVVTVGVDFTPNIAEISTGGLATYARLVDGTVLQWGSVDINSTITVPTPVPSLTNVVQVVGGWLSACARKVDHTVWCWGSNFFQQLGPNVALNATVQIPVQVPPSNIGVSFGALSMGHEHACGYEGTNLACWGTNSSGQLGNGTTTSNPMPTVVANGSTVSAGDSHTCIVDELANVDCAGQNTSGQLGAGTLTNSLQFLPTSLKNAVAVSAGGLHTCVLMGDATVRCFGDNTVGQLGDGTFVRRTTPVTVVGLANVVQLQAGANHTCALLQNGTVSCWGNAAMVGAGVVADQATPVTVPGLAGVTAIHTASSGAHTCAELGDHTVRCWGSNSGGQIGNGSTVFANRPTAVIF